MSDDDSSSGSSDDDSSSGNSYCSSYSVSSSDGSRSGDRIPPLPNRNIPEDDDWDVVGVPRRLPRNDPRLRHLQIGGDCAEFCPRDEDWERFGECLANHTYLKKVIFGERIDGITRDKLEAMYRGIARSKSINKVWAYDLAGEEAFLLAAAFRDNPNLRMLTVGSDVTGDEYMDDERTKLLAEALAKFHSSSLTDFEFLGRDDIGDDTLKCLFEALTTGQSQLKHLCITKGHRFGRESGIALAALVQNPKSELRSLELQGNTIGNEGAAVLAVALAGNSTLTTIKLSGNQRIGTTGWIALSAVFRSPCSRLENVSFSGGSVNDAAMVSMGRALAENTTIRSLTLPKTSVLIEAPGTWQACFGYLEDPSSQLVDLTIICNGFNDAAMNSLARSLVRNSTLQSLCLTGLTLTGDSVISTNGLRAFSAVLRAPRSALKTLSLCCYYLSEESATFLANSLSNNTMLEYLCIQVSETDIEAVRGVFLQMLCNESTITDTYLSNHALGRLIGAYPQGKLRPLLQINKENDPKAAARIKIIRVHFSGNPLNLQPILDMKPNVLPVAVAWMLRDDKGLNLSYQLIRAQPSMFGYRQPRNEKSPAGLTSLAYRFWQSVPALFNHNKGGSRKRKRGAW